MILTLSLLTRRRRDIRVYAFVFARPSRPDLLYLPVPHYVNLHFMGWLLTLAFLNPNELDNTTKLP